MMKILVVEDEAAIRTNLQILLRVEGYDVMTAENGLLGRIAALEHQPDLIISDVMMPEMDGFGLLAALRSEPLTTHTPFILLTARTERQDVRQGMSLGADDYLPKPFQRDELLQAVRTQLEKRVEQREATAKLAAQAQRLRHYDDLTSLPNLTLLKERLAVALAAARSHGQSLALVLIGLDGFSRINDSLGRVEGDALLKQVAHRLRQHQDQIFIASIHDTVARTESDVFALLIAELADRNYISSRISDIAGLFSQPFTTGAGEQFLGASLGVAVHPDDGDDAEALLTAAGTALRAAKQGGGGETRFFKQDMNAEASQRLALHNDLYRALERNEISLFYQPQVDLASNRVVGFEALMRWQHAERGFVSPALFIPIAESDGHILKLGAWALDEACRQMAAWRAAGFAPVRVAVNLSSRQFLESNLVEQVNQALIRHQIPPACLELEITEGTAMQSGENTVAILHRLKQLGVKLALDDFGTGYSSLAYLKRFPLDVLKVDQIFVRNLTSDQGDAAIVRAVIALAKSFGMSVIAEGVEMPAQRQFLESLACEEMQGYLFSKPVPADEAARFLLPRQP
jgi:diguanylate cyclase